MSENNVNITIANRLATAHDKISDAAKKADRHGEQISLVAVSKTKPSTDIEAAYESGQRTFGENYVQELTEKAQQLSSLSDLCWHFIGPVQSNKTALIAKYANWVDSVDRIKIARRLNSHCEELNKRLNVLIQVNISDSNTKSGIPLKDVESFAKEIQQFKNLTVRGLMAIPDEYHDKEKQKAEFEQLNTCFLALKHQYQSVDTLSLGMTNDMEAAILSGSTMIRLGTAIFGPRTD